MASADEPPNKSDSDADWHPADILAALKKRGHSLAGLSVANGYHPTAAGKALKTPWPTMEILIAEALGVSRDTIWPSRKGLVQNVRRGHPGRNKK